MRWEILSRWLIGQGLWKTNRDCAHVGDIKIRARQVDNMLVMCKQEAKKPIGRERAIENSRSRRCWMLLCCTMKWNRKSNRCLVKFISSSSLSSVISVHELWTALYACCNQGVVIWTLCSNYILALIPVFYCLPMMSLFLHTSLSWNEIALHKKQYKMPLVRSNWSQQMQ